MNSESILACLVMNGITNGFLFQLIYLFLACDRAVIVLIPGDVSDFTINYTLVLQLL